MIDSIRRMIQEIIGAKPDADEEYVKAQIHERFKRSGMQDGLRDKIGRQNVDDLIRTIIRK